MEIPSSAKEIESEAKIDDDKLFGKLLYDNRKFIIKKESKEIASEVGVSPSSVSAWENGRAFPEVGRESAVADAYGIKLEKLIKFFKFLEISKKAHQMKMDISKEAQRDQKPKPDKI